jgi:hypothetical protein
MSQVLGMFGLLDFTMLRPILGWRAFWNLKPFIPLIFKFLGGCGELRITETADTESVTMGAHLYYE